MQKQILPVGTSIRRGKGYMRAYLLDPKQYYAALFIGDTFFKQHQPGFAGAMVRQRCPDQSRYRNSISLLGAMRSSAEAT